MELIKPESCLKLNIPEIDSQHETLIGLINQIHESMLQQANKTILDGLLSELLEHTRSHFDYEEQLMSRYGYPGYEAHKVEHIKLIEHVADLIERSQNGELLLTFAVVLKLKGWASVHIEKSDKRLCTFLQGRMGVDSSPG